MSRLKPQHIILALVVLLFAVILIPLVTDDHPGRLSNGDGVITQTIAVLDTDATAAFDVRTQEGSDAEHESSHMFGSLVGLPGLGRVSLDIQGLKLAVTYDSSVIDEARIRARLLEAGYVVPNHEDATPTQVAPDGSVQRISITDSGDGFEPNLFLAKTDVPIVLEFGPGQDCRIAVAIPELGIEQDISAGGDLFLPALEPGEYQIVCSGDAQEALILVE